MTIELTFHAPIGRTALGVPIYPLTGARSGGGISFAVGDDDGDDPQFDDERDDADPDEDDDEQDDDADEQDDEDAPRGRQRKQGDDWQPPTRDAWERVQGALKRANGEAGKRRRVGKTMDKLGIDDLETWLTERGIDPTTGLPYGGDVVNPGDDEDAPDDGYEREDDVRGRRDTEREQRARDKQTARQIAAAEQRGRRAAQDAVMPILAEQSARLALRGAGFTGTDSQLERLLRTIDPGSLDLDMDDSGFELLGIEEAIEDLKADFPSYFQETAPKRRTPARASARSATRRASHDDEDDRSTSAPRGGARSVDGGDRGRQRGKTLGWAELMVKQMEERGR